MQTYTISNHDTGTTQPSNVLGTIALGNLVRGEVDAPVYDVDGVTLLQPPGYTVQGYAGLTPDSLAPVFPTTEFINIPGAAGYFQPQQAEWPGYTGGTIFFQVRVWENAKGATYEQTVAAGGKIRLFQHHRG